MSPAIQLSPCLLIPVPIQPWGISLNVTTNYLILKWKEPKRIDLISRCHWIFYLPCSVLLRILPLVFVNSFPRSIFKQWFTNMHVIFLLYSKPLHGFCIFPWLQKPPYNARPLESIPILVLLFFSPPSFPLVVLASLKIFHPPLMFDWPDFPQNTFRGHCINLSNFENFSHILSFIAIQRLNFAPAMHSTGVSKRTAVCLPVLMLTHWQPCYINSSVSWLNLWAMLLHGLY